MSAEDEKYQLKEGDLLLEAPNGYPQILISSDREPGSGQRVFLASGPDSGFREIKHEKIRDSNSWDGGFLQLSDPRLVNPVGYLRRARKQPGLPHKVTFIPNRLPNSPGESWRNQRASGSHTEGIDLEDVQNPPESVTIKSSLKEFEQELKERDYPLPAPLFRLHLSGQFRGQTSRARCRNSPP